MYRFHSKYTIGPVQTYLLLFIQDLKEIENCYCRVSTDFNFVESSVFKLICNSKFILS